MEEVLFKLVRKLGAPEYEEQGFTMLEGMLRREEKDRFTVKEAIIALDALLTLLLPNSQRHCPRPNENSSESEAASSSDEIEGEKMEVDEDEFWKSDSDAKWKSKRSVALASTGGTSKIV
jgi:hypothetical protein